MKVFRVVVRYYSDQDDKIVFIYPHLALSMEQVISIIRYDLTHPSQEFYRCEGDDESTMGELHTCTALRTNITVRDQNGKFVPWKQFL